LLEEESNVCRQALITDFANPASFDWATSWPALTSDDHPMDIVEWESRDWPEQWLDRDESHCGRDLTQVVDSRRVARAFDGYALPDIAWPRKARRELSKSFASFGQDLKRMPRGLAHYSEDLPDVLCRDGFMKEIAHTVDEDHSWPTPTEGKTQEVWVQRQLETVAIPRVVHCVEARGEALRITILAPGADFCAAGDGIPGCVRPFDAGLVAHGYVSSPKCSRGAASLN